MRERVYSVLLLGFLFFFNLYSFSESMTLKNKEYPAQVSWTKETFPGDAVFLRLNIKKTELLPKGNVILKEKESGKKAGESELYPVITDNKKESLILLTGIPLSSYLKEGEYEAVLSLSQDSDKIESYILPVTVRKKSFITETIPLNASNTAIKTDTSTKRSDQIKRLNNILYTTNNKSVYNDKPFIPPTDCKRRTSFFADRRIFAYSDGKSSTSLHYGIDYGVPEGTPVYACGDGIVVMAEDRISTGWSICIEHLPGLYSLYYHMSSLKVKNGDTVKAGSLIGLSGSTGLATGPHLHWEVRLLSQAVNPDFFTEDFTFSKD